jgi:hypothetical protein
LIDFYYHSYHITSPKKQLLCSTSCNEFTFSHIQNQISLFIKKHFTYVDYVLVKVLLFLPHIINNNNNNNKEDEKGGDAKKKTVLYKAPVKNFSLNVRMSVHKLVYRYLIDPSFKMVDGMTADFVF